MALRLCLTLGLHHNVPEGYTISAVEREHRIRVWWSVYIIDRMTSSKLGHPVTVQDSDIDVDLPSMDNLTPSEQEEFSDPSHLIAHVKLARISGDIISDIYGRSSQTKAFVQSVQKILRSLRTWAETLPASVQISQTKPLKYSSRNVASLHLCFNQVSLRSLPFIFIQDHSWMKKKVRNTHHPPNPIPCFQILLPRSRRRSPIINHHGPSRCLHPRRTQLQRSPNPTLDRRRNGNLRVL